ncbi:hypothetical protein KJ845_00540, partial [Patescibacteria group bacterium]|nr:hypothetical protein [Patescibacteria group bacterium]
MDQDDLNKNTTALPDPASSGLSGLPPLPALDTAEDDTFSPPPAPPQPLPPVKVSPEPTPISHSGDESARTPESQQTDSGQAPAERDSGRMTKKKFSKKTIIGGIIALVLLVAVPLVALNLDKFSGDIRQRAAPPTEKSQCVGCADKNHEWEWTNGKCKKKYKKDCQGGGGGSDSCAGSLSASTCKTVSVGDRCVGFNGTCKRTTDDNCACVPDPTATPGPTPYCSRTCTGNFYCQPDLNGGTCVIDIPTPIPTAIINECENAGGACFYTPSCQKINKQTVNGGNGCSDIGGGEICCGGIVVPPDSCLTAGETCGPYVDPKCCSDLECNDFFNGYGVCKSSGSDQECENAGGACFYTPSCQKINKQTVNGGNGCSDIG